ncbi:vq motif-containing protein 22 [Abeliophyllum distichum]|uniref:Vq motif-containing protein 22 n=1 Tax=Abeliophyllum distichum TaxID=126358 RepID=A0ABD1UJ08_9LAMI
MQRSDGIVSTKRSYPPTTNTELFPKLRSIDKPIRKRFKASKKTPVTHLNANTTNFRALVQQFTGCRSAGSYKGPINLNFGVPTQENDFNESLTISLLGYNYYTKKTHEQQQQLEDKKFLEDEAGFFSYDTNFVSDDAFVSTFSKPTSDDQLTLDAFDIDNISSQDLSGTMINDDFWGY